MSRTGHKIRYNKASPARKLSLFKSANAAHNMLAKGSPEEIEDIILFLLNAQSAWVKGQDIIIDGGMSAMGLTDTLELPA